jgi:hypothetical protein
MKPLKMLAKKQHFLRFVKTTYLIAIDSLQRSGPNHTLESEGMHVTRPGAIR